MVVSELEKKLLEIKKRVPYLKPNEKGFGYDYVDPSRVLGVFNPLFNEYGILLEPAIIDSEIITVDVYQDNKMRKDGDEPTKVKTEVIHNVTMEFTFIDVETGERKTIPWMGAGSNGMEQGFGSALTYAERYFLLKYFNVPVNQDDPNYYRTTENKKQTAPTKKLTKANTTALIKALDNGSKKPIDVRNSLTEYVQDDNVSKVLEYLNKL